VEFTSLFTLIFICLLVLVLFGVNERLKENADILNSTQPSLGERLDNAVHVVGRLQGDFGKFREEFALLGKHVGHVQASYQTADRRLEQFGQKLLAADTGQVDLFEAPPARTPA
jgi:hypothetical protein